MNDTSRDSGRSFMSVPTTDEDTIEAFEMARITDDSQSSSALIGILGYAEDQSQASWRGDPSTTELHPSNIKEPVRMSSRLRVPAKQWLAEISSFIVGAGALVCIIVLMVRYNHLMGHFKWMWYRSARPLHQYATLDEATRGPWGSTKLLFSIPRLNFITLGAMITIASLGIGAATQQAVQTYACSKVVPGQPASIPIARNASGGFRMIVNPGSADQLKMFDTAMNAAFVAGLAGQPKTLPFVCATGNCTYIDVEQSTYSTIVFDSYCSDVSHSIQQLGPVTWSTTTPYGRSKVPGNGTGATNYTVSFSVENNVVSSMISYSLESYATFRHAQRWSPAVSISGLQLPKLTLSAHDEILSNISALTRVFLVPSTSPCDTSGQGIYENDLEDVQPVAAVNTSRCQTIQTNNVTSFPGSWSLTAAVCYLYPSLRRYNGQIINGRLDEREIGESVPMHRGSISSSAGYHTSYFIFSDPCVIDGSAYTATNYSNAPDLITLLDRKRNANITGPRACLYALPSSWDEAIADSIGTVLTQPTAGTCVTTDNYSDMLCGNQWWLSDLYNERNSSLASISQFMKNIADSLTTQLRIIGTDITGKPAFVSGTTFRTEVCTRFVWEWLLFPALLAALVAVLLVAVNTLPNMRSGVPWKMSSLPLLFYGMTPASTLKRTSDLEVLDENRLVEIARGVKVRFEQSDTGWGFQEVK
ncbi:hypothetical protein BLS_009297 [Venturia inaequalis]|uniref:Uncharacterized protein n=2 Tax=Venturia inaequalis TaxID=5025 RepID=A0A8H3Z519_VENIN|nr:hypothetical protein BLS_009297 [Venturia inaequalis]